MENEPLHPPISQKMHWQPGLSFRHFNYITIMENIRCSGASLTRISRSPVHPVIQGSAVSVVKSSPAAFVGAPMENSKASSFIKGLALLGVMRTAGAPFERVKLLMQNQNEMIISGRLPKRYNGIFDCFATTIRNEGIVSLWRGNIAFVTAYLSSETHTGRKVAVFLSAVVNQFLVYPLYYAGTRMANDVITSSNSRERQFNGIFDVYRKTLKSDGIAGVYRGFNIMIPKIALLRAVTAVSKPWQQFLLHHFQGSVLGRAVVNTLYASCRSMAVHPLDTVSRRMMMTSGAVKYRHSLHAITCIFYNEGVKSFYSGAKAQILTLAVYQVYGLCLRYVVGVLRRKNTGDK
ncbi:hypothetical protein ES288_D10G031000v1 [Gossypium darwinii]|uniref:ADP/ATP translocase n=1 Tax=Gossypium darwinii TaxID=34276 RepID=A0A5D2AZ95_GOSDA|nr:hypothetical protein ES288_D10G031000v1 [Gossypium darwinii]